MVWRYLDLHWPRRAHPEKGRLPFWRRPARICCAKELAKVSPGSCWVATCLLPMVEEIDLSPGEGEVRPRSLGLGVYLCRGQFRDSFASRTKKNGQSWKAGSEQQVCCCTLVQPTPKVYGPGCLTKAEPPRKFPYRPVIGTAAPRRPPPPGRPAGKRPGAVPLPARPLPIQLSSPVSIPSHPRHPRRPPLPAPLKLKAPSDRRSPHRAPGITDLIFSFSQHSLATPSFLSSLQLPSAVARKLPSGDRPPLGLSGNFSLLVATTKRQLDCALHHTTGSLL